MIEFIILHCVTHIGIFFSSSKSQFRDVYSLQQILSSPSVHAPLTKLQCCPTSDGAAAAILASEEFVRKHGLQDRVSEDGEYFN